MDWSLWRTCLFCAIKQQLLPYSSPFTTFTTLSYQVIRMLSVQYKWLLYQKEKDWHKLLGHFQTTVYYECLEYSDITKEVVFNCKVYLSRHSTNTVVLLFLTLYLQKNIRMLSYKCILKEINTVCQLQVSDTFGTSTGLNLRSHSAAGTCFPIDVQVKCLNVAKWTGGCDNVGLNVWWFTKYNLFAL